MTILPSFGGQISTPMRAPPLGFGLSHFRNYSSSLGTYVYVKKNQTKWLTSQLPTPENSGASFKNQALSLRLNDLIALFRRVYPHNVNATTPRVARCDPRKHPLT